MKKSIARQVAAAFIGMVGLLLVLILVMNNFFLGQYYLLRTERILVQAYDQVDMHVDAEDGPDTDFLEGDFKTYRMANNISIVIADSSYSAVYKGDNDVTSDVMEVRIWGYSMGVDKEAAQTISTTDEYQIWRKTDDVDHQEYLEIWGELASNYHVLMRIPMVSIRGSVRISNDFVIYLVIVALVMAVIMIMWLSRRIARPIRELTALSERMANLDFNAKYTSGGEDEIGQLGQHFNQMSETLEDTISKLKTANIELQKDLDAKVQIDEMRKEFLSNVSHELKTPIALIQGYSEGLKDCVNDDAESREFYCDVIIDEASKMNELVKKLLTLNQLEFGNEQVELKRFDLGFLIRAKVQSTQILAQKKDATLVYTGPEELHAWGDEFKVEEVLTNYLSNAINHVDGEKRIEVRVERIEGTADSGAADPVNGTAAGAAAGSQEAAGGAANGVGTAGTAADRSKSAAAQRHARIRTTVFNTGAGIPEEDLDKVWVKFFKVDKARTREYGGSGVGLSIVRAIMDSFRQECGVRNVEDGVEFWFDLEAADGELIQDEMASQKRVEDAYAAHLRQQESEDRQKEADE